MLLSHITFDDGLDISPPTNEEFRYELGSHFIYHWILSNERPPLLFAAYNTKYIREMSFYNPNTKGMPSISSNTQLNSTDTNRADSLHTEAPLASPSPSPDKNNFLPNVEEEPEEDEHNFDALQSEAFDYLRTEDILSDLSQDAEVKTAGPRLIDICTCDPDPDPNCPICNHEHLHAQSNS